MDFKTIVLEPEAPYAGQALRKHLEFPFPIPPEVAPAAPRPPRAILSLRGAGSMRYLKGKANPDRAAFFSALGLDPRRVVATELRHTRRLRLVEAGEARAQAPNGGVELDLGALRGEDFGDGGPDKAAGLDGLVFIPSASSSDPGLHSGLADPVATVTVADCMPIWIWDAQSGAWGLLHSGWKGTGILENAVRAIVARCATSAASLSVVLGPAIGACCYDVSEERARSFEAEFGEGSVDRLGDKPRIDIRAANIAMARALGVGALLSVESCTSCSPSLGSFRREGSAAFTRMVALCVPR